MCCVFSCCVFVGRCVVGFLFVFVPVWVCTVCMGGVRMCVGGRVWYVFVFV